MARGSFVATLLFTIALGATAWAIKDPETGLVFPDKSACGGKPAKAVGVGVREATFGINVYGVVLYASDAVAGQSLRQTSSCVKIRARFVRDVGADKIRNAWIDGLKKKGMSPADASLKRFIGVIRGEMKDKHEMVIEVDGDKVSFRYLKKSVAIDKASKLGRAIKRLYLDSDSPTPALVRDIAHRKIARP